VNVVRKPSDDRRAALAQQVHTLVSQGRRIESQDDYSAVLVRGRWIEFREIVGVDEWGNPSVERLPIDRSQILKIAGMVVLVLLFIIYWAVQ
jgi:hypothetical protein